MKFNNVIVIAVGLLAGCVSEQFEKDIAEFDQWQKSSDYVRNTTFPEFRKRYQVGWRERVEIKEKQKQIEKEKIKSLKEDYELWCKSEDYVPGATVEYFKSKVRSGWRERVAEYEEWKKSSDYSPNVSCREFHSPVRPYRNGWRERANRKDYDAWLLSPMGDSSIGVNEFLKNHRNWKEKLVKREQEEAADPIKARQGRIERITEQKLRKIHEACQYESQKAQLVNILKNWVNSRLPLSESDKNKGEALLSDFALKYLPNAYANYEKIRNQAFLQQQIFNDNFSNPTELNIKSHSWPIFKEFIKKFATNRTEYFMCRDELCHYWLSWKLGVLSAVDLEEIDKKTIAIELLPENIDRADYVFTPVKTQEVAVAEFAIKYVPETYALYKQMQTSFTEIETLLKEVFNQHIIIDDIRFNRALAVAVDKRNDLARAMNELVDTIKIWQKEHRLLLKSSEDLFKSDHNMRIKLTSFIKSLPSYIKNRVCGSVIPDSDMIAIPEKKYKIQRTEVTQMQWMIVMGENPSKYKGPNRPVDSVSWNDCQKFISKLNRKENFKYRLPTEQEFEYACRAGASNGYCKLIDGRESTYGTIKQDGIAWLDRRRSRMGTLPVATMQPNAFGLYDMIGNVMEWTASESSKFNGRGGHYIQGMKVLRGGSFDCYENLEEPYYANPNSTESAIEYNAMQATIGFRLVCDAQE